MDQVKQEADDRESIALRRDVSGRIIVFLIFFGVAARAPAQSNPRAALPSDPRACLDAAGRGWDVSDVQPFFDCWRTTASRDDLVAQAVSGTWTVRALALHALASPLAAQRRLVPLVAMPPAPAPPVGSALSRAAAAMPSFAAAAVPPVPELDPATRQRLLQSAVEVLSHDLSGVFAPDTLSYTTAALVRDAFWELSGRDMAVALKFADRIVPSHGHYTTAGRFGESYYLDAKDHAAYIANRRPAQVLAAGLAALLMTPLLAFPRFRRLGAALVASLSLWSFWCAFQSEFRELPPPPLYYLTTSCLAFLSAGLATALLTGWRVNAWLKVLGAPIAAGVCGFVLCGFTRSASLFPIDSEGWELIFDPASSALISAPVAFVLALCMAQWKPAVSQPPRSTV